MERLGLPEWESELIDEAIKDAEARLEAEKRMARKRAVQLAREQGYHRLAFAIDRPAKTQQVKGQLQLFPIDNTLFDEAG